MDSYRGGNTSGCGICSRFNNLGLCRMTGTDKVFKGCVNLLEWTADKTGLTYVQVNVWVFCVVWPSVTVGLIAALFIK